MFQLGGYLNPFLRAPGLDATSTTHLWWVPGTSFRGLSKGVRQRSALLLPVQLHDTYSDYPMSPLYATYPRQERLKLPLFVTELAYFVPGGPSARLSSPGDYVGRAGAARGARALGPRVRVAPWWGGLL